MRRYRASELVPGQFSGYHDPDEGHRVDPDDPSKPTLRDRVARLLSNAYSPQPGRLCMTKQDYLAADEVMALLGDCK